MSYLSSSHVIQGPTTARDSEQLPEQAGPRRRRGMTALLSGLGFFTLGPIVAAAIYMVVRPWHLRWGATDSEATKPLLGDDLVAGPGSTGYSTRAITINAPAEAIWPWLVQMGQGRGGLYSYDWLENLIGCDIHSIDQIVPDLQTLKVGDEIRLYKEGGGPPPYLVAVIDPGRALVLGMPHADSSKSATDWLSSWAFVLNKVDEEHTRLLIRWRGKPYAGDFLVEPLQFIMERKMLYGIKGRVEKLSSV